VTGLVLRVSALALGVVASIVVSPEAAPSRTKSGKAKPPASAPPAPETKAAPWPGVHEVRRGDTLSGIAQRYGVRVSALVSANALRGPGVTLRIGQRLRIPGAPSVGQAPSPKTVSVAVGRRPGERLDRVPRNVVLAVPDLADIAPLFTWPVEGPVSSAFGRRRLGWHRGIDVKADLGVPILAAAPGLVYFSGYEVRYGRVVKIEHPNGFVTVYAHNDENFVEIGDRVTAGQRIASIGRTGRATAHHLHFEIRQNGFFYNPLYFLPLPPRVAVLDDGDEEPHDGDEADE
jgi:murein DD-endopeptidase MepM/ murein hydrolase activator NlpD